VVVAWDTDGQIYFAKVKPGTTEFTKPQGVPGSGRARKHPVVAVNTQGELTLVWTEGTGWQKGGALAWQVFGKTGKPMDQKGRINRAIPVWGLPTVVATGRGFLIIH
jgi:hypothetical protein